MTVVDADVVIVGAGIIGLASAVAIADTGRTVCLVDPAVARGASRAAAGMLSPGAEWSVEDATLGQMMRDARRAWPQFADRIRTIADVPLAVREVGSLFVAWDGSDRREWQRHLDVIDAQGVPSLGVDRDGSADLFRPISSRITSGAYIADDAYVDADEVLSALVTAAQRLGVDVRPWDVQAVSDTGATVEAHSEHGVVRARCGIIAAGVASSLAVNGATAVNRVRPIRGVTLRLAAPPPTGAWMVRAIVLGRHLYVIARDDGSVVIGATSEENSEAVVLARDVRQLLDDVSMIVPSLDEATFVESRVGLRPAPDSNRPFFERIASTRWAWSSGYFRHGFLLAPTAAEHARAFAEDVV